MLYSLKLTNDLNNVMLIIRMKIYIGYMYLLDVRAQLKSYILLRHLLLRVVEIIGFSRVIRVSLCNSAHT